MNQNKFSKGDKVIVISLDEEMANEPYDCLGEDYKETLYKVGTVTSIETHRENPYTVYFPDLPNTYDTWYFNDKEIILYDPNINMDNIKLLYGKKI